MVDDYIRREDAIRLAEQGQAQGFPWQFQMLVRLPPADVVQVVRCKDCKHYYFADNRIPQEQRYVCEISGEIWKPDSFCSYGERREE